jgi:hypothetical protein
MSFVQHCQDEGRLPAGDVRSFALLARSMVHGVAKLGTANRLPYGVTDACAMDCVQARTKMSLIARCCAQNSKGC